jgi:hypothetical protein
MTQWRSVSDRGPTWSPGQRKTARTAKATRGARSRPNAICKKSNIRKSWNIIVLLDSSVCKTLECSRYESTPILAFQRCIGECQGLTMRCVSLRLCLARKLSCSFSPAAAARLSRRATDWSWRASRWTSRTWIQAGERFSLTPISCFDTAKFVCICSMGLDDEMPDFPDLFLDNNQVGAIDDIGEHICNTDSVPYCRSVGHVLVQLANNCSV